MTICRLFLLAVVQMLFTSCATVLKTPVQRISVHTDPPGANVVLSTGEKGVTPYSVWKGRSRDFSLHVYKNGYKPVGVKVHSRKSISGVVATVGNVAIGGLIGVGVDWLSGSTNELYPNRIEARLAPLNSPAHSIVFENGDRLPKYRTSPATRPKPPGRSPPETYVAAPKKTPRLSPTARSSDKRVTNRNLPQPKRTPRLAQSTSPYRTDASGTLYLDGY